MIRILCPRCKRQIDLEDFRAGHVGRCLQCRQKFRVPGTRHDARGEPTIEYRSLANAPPLAIEVEPEEAGAYGHRPGSSGQMELVEEPPPIPRSSHRVREEPEEEEDEPRPVQRKRKKKKKKGRNVSAGQVLPVLLGAVAAVALLVGIAWFFRPAVYAVFILGALCTLAGRAAFLQIAREDGAGTYLACLFVPFYSTFYFLKRINVMLAPFLIGCCGYVLLAAAALLFLFHDIHGLAEHDDGQVVEPGSLMLQVDGKPVTLPLKEMYYHHVKRGRDKFPDGFEFVGNGVSICGMLPLGFEENWETLVGKPIDILAHADSPVDADSEITLPGRGALPITGGSFTIRKVSEHDGEAFLQGTIVLECAGDLKIEGTFRVSANGVY